MPDRVYPIAVFYCEAGKWIQIEYSNFVKSKPWFLEKNETQEFVKMTSTELRSSLCLAMVLWPNQWIHIAEQSDSPAHT